MFGFKAICFNFPMLPHLPLCQRNRCFVFCILNRVWSIDLEVKSSKLLSKQLVLFVFAWLCAQNMKRAEEWMRHVDRTEVVKAAKSLLSYIYILKHAATCNVKLL